MAPLALVVENDGGTRKLLDVLLTRFGCEVDAVANGADALLLLERIDYDLTLIDLMTPGRSGSDLVDWMGTHRPAAVARTAMLSSAPAPLIHGIREAHPALRVIDKPFEITEIIELIEGARQRPERAPIAPADQFSRRSIAAGAKSGVLVRRIGSHLELVHNYGYGPQIASWFPLAASEPFPLCSCVRDGRPQWIASPAVAAARYPHLLPIWRENHSSALASVPLIRQGEIIGAAGWTFREPQPFDENERRAFTTIAAEAVAALGGRQSGAPASA